MPKVNEGARKIRVRSYEANSNPSCGIRWQEIGMKVYKHEQAQQAIKLYT